MSILDNVHPSDQVAFGSLIVGLCLVGCMCLFCPGGWCVRSSGGSPETTITDDPNDLEQGERKNVLIY